MRTTGSMWCWFNPKKKSKIEDLEDRLSYMTDIVYENEFVLFLLLKKLDLKIKTIKEKRKIVSNKKKK